MRLHLLSRPPTVPPTDPATVVAFALPDADPLPAWVDADALSADERGRAERLRHPRARFHFVRGRTLVRAVLGHRLGCSPRDVPLSVTADGKPVLDESVTTVCHFNVSHTAGVVVVAVGPVPVGVDVEAATPGRDFPGLVSRYFADEERAEFARLPDGLKVPAFYRGWTGKEALLKGVGCGVRELHHCAVALDPRVPPRVLRCPLGERDWHLVEWAVGDGFAAAVAVKCEGAPDVRVVGAAGSPVGASVRPP